MTDQTEQGRYQQLLKPSDYCDGSVFDSECRTVFANTWQFVTTTDALEKHNDFFTLNVGLHPVVVQNFEGELRAFENICSHRFGRIQVQEHGNRPLVCSYHSFCYKKDGSAEPPALLRLRLSAEERAAMKLREFAVQTCGNFVFVCLKPPNEVEPLISYLAEAGEHLLLCSKGMGERIDAQDEIIGANWKIVVENFLEFAHIPTVHQATFGRIGLDGSAGVDLKLDALHSWGLLRADAQRLASNNAQEDREYLSNFQCRPFKPMGSHVYFIFPNLVAVSVFGLSYLLTTIHPETPNTSKLRYRLFEAQPDQGAMIRDELRQKRRAVLKAFAYQTVIGEDKDIVETLQHGTAYTQKSGVLGAAEERVNHFQQGVIRYRV